VTAPIAAAVAHARAWVPLPLARAVDRGAADPLQEKLFDTPPAAAPRNLASHMRLALLGLSVLGHEVSSMPGSMTWRYACVKGTTHRTVAGGS
jgi:hypothetical protein